MNVLNVPLTFAFAERRPLIVFAASGGARMQEGLTSLMQMAKTSAIIGKMNDEKIPFISVLTHPTYGGVSASFAMLGMLLLLNLKHLLVLQALVLLNKLFVKNYLKASNKVNSYWKKVQLI